MNALHEKNRILVVDDEPQVLRSIQGLLEDDFVVLANTDGEKALRLLEQEEVSVILSDQRMPGLTGDQFLKEAQKRSQAVRVLITGYADLDALVRAVNDGKIYAYVEKPWDPIGLRTTVQNAVDYYRLTRENQRLTSELLRTNTQLQVINRQQTAVVELGQCALEGTDLSTLMDRTVSLVAQTLDVEHSKILELLPDGSALRLRAGVGWKEGYVGYATVGVGTDSQAGYTLLSNEPVVLNNFQTERRFHVPALLRDHGVISGASVAIPGQGRPFGVLGADTVRQRTFSQDDAHFLQSVANVLSEAIERKQAEEKEQQQYRRIALLNQIARAIDERQDLESIFRVVLQHLEDHLPIAFGGFYLYDPQNHVLNCTARGPKAQALAAELGMPDKTTLVVEGTPFRACLTGETVYVPNVNRVDTFLMQKLAQAEVLSAVGTPLIAAGKMVGILFGGRREVDGFSSAEVEFLKVLGEHVALAVHQAHLYESLRKAYDDLRQTQQAVMQQERLKALGQMASGVVHDINNALSPVMGYAQMLLMDEQKLDADQTHCLNVIHRSAQDIGHIVSRMREFYRQREDQELLLPVNLNQVMKQVLDMTRPRWRDMPQEQGVVIEIENDPQDPLPSILGMEAEIREAMINLIFNAVDSMPHGGRLTIKTRFDDTETRRHGDAEKALSHRVTASPRLPVVAVEVTDTGVGMDEETRQHCLEPFYSTKGEKGTGLGLAMVFGTVQRHEGRVEIESELGRGTTIRLTFPPQRDESKSKARPEALDRYTGPSLRLLCIDDDPSVLDVVKRLLEKDGHAVTVADGGQAGMDAFRAAQDRGEVFDVVFTDLGMPYVDGREVARTIKRESPDTPVIMLTGWGRQLTSQDAIPAEADAVLSKPPEIPNLRRALMQVAKKEESN